MSVSIASVTAGIRTFEQITNNELAPAIAKIGTPEDTHAFRRTLDKQKVNWATQKEKMLKDMNTLKKQCRDSPDETEYTVLSKKWKKLYVEFEQQRRKLLDKQKEVPQPAAGGKKRAVEEVPEEDDEFGGGDDIMAQLQPKYNMSALHTEEAIQAEKAREIAEIETDVNELGAMYVDFNVMVKEQGVMLQSAKENVESAQENMQAGTANVQQASTYQKKSRKKMCCLVVFFLIVLIVIIVVVSV